MVKVGDRVVLEGSIRDSATVKFYGPTKFAAGNWVGLELDHKTGRNDGNIDGIRYFDMVNRGDGINHGLFTRLTNVKLLKEASKKPMDLNEAIKSLRKQIQTKDEEYSLLQKKYTDSKQLYESRVEELQFTVDGLTLKDTDLNTEISNIKEEFQLIKDENVELKNEVIILQAKLENAESIDILDEEETDDISPQELVRQNKYLKGIVKKMELSSNDLIQQYEDSLNDNTELLKQNIELKETMSKLQTENEQNRIMIEELSEKFEAEDNSENIITYLTESNNDLNATIITLNGQINEYKKIMEKFEESQTTTDNSTLALQKKLESSEIDLNKNELLLEEEYEKNIALSKKLQTLSDTVYTTQSQEIIRLENKIKNLEEAINKEKLFKRFGEYYLNSDSTATEIILVQVRMLEIVLEDSIDGNMAPLHINFILLYFKTLDIIIYYFKSQQLSQTIIQDFTEEVFEFNKWKSDILESKFNLENYNIDSIISFISTHNLSNDPNLNIFILNCVFKEIIPNIVTILKSSSDPNTISQIYSVVLSNEELIKTLIPKIKYRESQLKETQNLPSFTKLLQNLFKTFIGIDVDMLIAVMSGFKEYLETLNDQLNSFERDVIKDESVGEIDLKGPSSNEPLPHLRDKNVNPHEELINELKLRVNVLTEKSNESKLKEDINIQLKDDIQRLSSQLNEEIEKVEDYDKKLNKVTNKLEEVKLNSLQLIKDKKLTGALMKHDEINKLDLMTEVHYLKNNLLDKIKVHNSASAIKNDFSFEWLVKDKDIYERDQCMRSKNIYQKSPSQQYDRDIDRLLNSATKLVDKIQIDHRAKGKDQLKLNDRIQRHDNIVKNVINELIQSNA